MKPEVHNSSHCDYACLGEDHLDRHVKHRHIDRNGKYRCEWCKYSTNYISHITNHRRVHTGERPFICDDCGMAFSERGNLVVHRRKNKYITPYVCDLCAKVIELKCALAPHKRFHIGGMACKCEQCGAKFNDLVAYTNHLKWHNAVKKCSARVAPREDPAKHVKAHKEEQQYGCSFCPARFKHKSNARKHVVALHTHDYKYRCGRCGKGFIIPGRWRRHEGKCTLTDALQV